MTFSKSQEKVPTNTANWSCGLINPSGHLYVDLLSLLLFLLKDYLFNCYPLFYLFTTFYHYFQKQIWFFRNNTSLEFETPLTWVSDFLNSKTTRNLTRSWVDQFSARNVWYGPIWWQTGSLYQVPRIRLARLADVVLDVHLGETCKSIGPKEIWRCLWHGSWCPRYRYR